MNSNYKKKITEPGLSNEFVQPKPTLLNPYKSDKILQCYLKRLLPEEVRF